MIFRLLILAFVVTNLNVTAQEKKQVFNVSGESILGDDISVTQAREKAIQQAKIEAMRKAGVPEFVSEVSVFQKSEQSSKDFTELFNSISSQEVSGEISSFTIKKEERTTNESGNFVVRVWLDAEVVLHERRADPTFYVTVNGINENYLSPQNLSFQVKPSGSGYLHVFIIDEKESSVLFPNTIERSEKLEPNQVYSFPTTKALDYEVSTLHNIEVNYVVILFTKKEFTYSQGNGVTDVLNFISQISPEEKSVRMFPIVIKKQL